MMFILYLYLSSQSVVWSMLDRCAIYSNFADSHYAAFIQMLVSAQVMKKGRLKERMIIKLVRHTGTVGTAVDCGWMMTGGWLHGVTEPLNKQAVHAFGK